MISWLKKYKEIVVAVAIALVLTTVPLIEGPAIVGTENWHGVPQSYVDEIIYYSQLSEIATGHLLFGNPYFLEHRNDPPLAIFVSSDLAAIPMFFGLSLQHTLIVDFLIWGAAFVILFYWWMREFLAPKWLSAAVALFAFLQSYDQIFRVSVRQEVYPFFILFYIAFAKFMRDPFRTTHIVFLGCTAAASFYIYGYLWQTVVTTMGMLFLYALARKEWMLARNVLVASGIGGVLGAPPFLYTLWVSQQQYFWESMNRWGLVDTHIPMAEVVYSGGWIGVTLLLIGLLYWRGKSFRTNEAIRFVFLFLILTGLSLWIMQGSNLLTGKLLETGEHIRRFIVVWLVFSTAVLGGVFWKYRSTLKKSIQIIASLLLMSLVAANVYFAYGYLSPFIYIEETRQIWTDEELVAKPLAWLEAHESSPVVVWGNPHDYSTQHVVTLSKHYVLFQESGEFNLLSNDEFQERYLVSQYFDQPTVDDLKKDIRTYVGRANTFHEAKTLERGIKICRALHLFSAASKVGCGTPLTSAELLGDPFFNALEEKFTTQIRPNIKAYLAKYHVSYILKDESYDPQYKPEELGAKKVYDDGKFALYKLP